MFVSGRPVSLITLPLSLICVFIRSHIILFYLYDCVRDSIMATVAFLDLFLDFGSSVVTYHNRPLFNPYTLSRFNRLYLLLPSAHCYLIRSDKVILLCGLHLRLHPILSQTTLYRFADFDNLRYHRLHVLRLNVTIYISF